MALNPDAKYPTRRAYVVKLRADAKPDALAGRLENQFTSSRELLDSIASDLEASADPRPTDPARP